MTGKRLGIGQEFEKGISLIAIMTTSMAGMIILAPCIAYLMGGVTSLLPEYIEPSIIASSILANDMGGAPLSANICRTPILGQFNGLVVGATMGATISFTIPVALEMAPQKHHRDILFGFLCGIITIPIGCIFGGLVCGIEFLPLIINLIPLIVFSAICAIGITYFPGVCIKIFSLFGKFMKLLILVGLGVGIFEFLTGTKLLPFADTIENGMAVCLNAAWVMTGMFPIVNVLARIIKKPLNLLGKKIGVNDTSTMGFLATLATSVNTFAMFKDMDRRGIILNAAFCISGGFMLAGHLAFTLAFGADFLPAVLVGKSVAAICATILSALLCNNFIKKNEL